MMTSPKIAAKLYREAKYCGRDISYALGLSRRFYQKAGGSRIMIYHGISLKDHTRFNPIFLTLKTFESHLKLYKKYFNVISLDDFYQRRFSTGKFNICITFDDGFANNHQYVLPLLEKYKMPATFFVTAIREAGYDVLWNDFLGIAGKYGPGILQYKGEFYHKDRYQRYISAGNTTLLAEKLRSAGFEEKAEMMQQLYPLAPFKENVQEKDYWLQMTVQQIGELSASPFASIGAHGYYHNDLSRISLKDAAEEMVRSKQFLESTTQKPVNSLAFPYGTYTRPVIEEAKRAGYNQLLAMDFHFEEDLSDPAMRERFTVNPFISPINQLHATITRKYEDHS